MTYEESVRFLYSLGNELKVAKYDLDRMLRLLGELGNPHTRGRFVHVAGTNGKGSTCAMIESGLRAAGFTTGLYTSPHLAEPTERIRIGGREISRERFVRAFEKVHRAAEQLIASGSEEHHPSYFECVTAMAFLELAACDWTVLEVGLGGRLDATNVVIPKLAVITPVDFDHEAWLGKDIQSIAAEKAGIIKPGVPVVIAGQRPEAEVVIRQRAKDAGADVVDVRDWPLSNVAYERRGSRFQMAGLDVLCPFAGAHQVSNARTAAVALREIGISAQAIIEGIATARWPGRLERVSENPEVVIDGAHNPSAARALADYVDRFYQGEKLTLIFGCMRDKAVEEVAGILFPRFAEVIVTAPQQARALAPEVFRGLIDHPNLRTAPSLPDAVAQITGTTFITGSLFLIAEARKLFLPPPSSQLQDCRSAY